MALIVQKFGGTSVANVECIKNAARRVAFERKRGHDLVVVVSAMAGVTNQLIDYVKAISATPHLEEYDVVVSSGEQITSGLLALTLQNLGIPAFSIQGWQVPIQSDLCHGKARIQDIPLISLKKALHEKKVPIVSGFQGISLAGRVTTFGRGGSDITAVALAATLNAVRCDLYKDVAGIYTADPRVVPSARKIDRVTYEEMLELASLGSKVLQHRAVELAMAHQVPLRIFSSFEESTGTEIIQEDQMLEKVLIHGIACTHNEAKITVAKVNNNLEISADIFTALADAGICVDMIIQNSSESQRDMPLTFTIMQDDITVAESILNKLKEILNFGPILVNHAVAKISVVGIGLRSHPHLTSVLFRTLSQKNIEVLGMTTSEIKISVLVQQDFAELAVRSLHSAYKLDQVEIEKPSLYAV